MRTLGKALFEWVKGLELPIEDPLLFLQEERSGRSSSSSSVGCDAAMKSDTYMPFPPLFTNQPRTDLTYADLSSFIMGVT